MQEFRELEAGRTKLPYINRMYKEPSNAPPVTYGFKPSEREWLTWAALIGGIGITILLWIIAYVVGGGR